MLNTWSSHSHGRLFLRSKAKTDNANAIENDSPDQNMIIIKDLPLRLPSGGHVSLC